MERVASESLGGEAAVAEATGEVRLLDDFDTLIRLYWPKVYRFALASLRDADAAGSVAQDCFWKAYRARGAFRGEASVQTWLMQIAVNLVRDQARTRWWRVWRREKDEGLGLLAGAVDAERGLLARERVAAVWQATAKLSERQRTVFLLRFVEEMELLEIARATGLTEGAVKNHLFRALRNVRREVGGAL